MRIARTMQVVGYALYAMAGVLRLIQGGDAAPIAWIAAYAVLGLAFHAGASAPLEARRRRLVALAVMVPAMFAMATIRPCPYGALALVVVASQAALVLAPGIVARPHYHEEQDELYFVHAGRARFALPGETRELGSGGLCHVESTTPRQVSSVGDEDLVMLVVGAKGGYVGRDGQLADPSKLG